MHRVRNYSTSTNGEATMPLIKLNKSISMRQMPEASLKILGFHGDKNPKRKFLSKTISNSASMYYCVLNNSKVQPEIMVQNAFKLPW